MLGNALYCVVIFIWVTARLFLQRQPESQEERMHYPRREGTAYTGVRDVHGKASSEVLLQYAHKAALGAERRGEA